MTEMKNLILRSISGAIYVALIVGSILLADGVFFPVICSLFALVGVWEFQKMTLDDFFHAPLTLLVDVIIAMLLPLSILLSYFFYGPFFAYMALAVLVMTRMVMALYSRQTDPVRRFAYSAASWIYIGLALLFACIVMTESRAVVMLMFVMIWLNDTGAFLVGCSIGRHRLFPRLSPKKSWEGFFGGMVFCVAAGVLAPVIFGESFRYYSPICLGLLGVVVSVMSTWGDLFESMIKRHAGVKDSGKLIPGHGGILDRIDSLLFVAPATLLFLCIYRFLESFILIKGA